MAEQLAELNKGELEVYSTAEKQVGVWIDGKPIYRKAYDLGSNLSLPSNTWKATNISKSGMSFLVDCRAYSLEGSYLAVYGALDVDNNYVSLLNSRTNSTSARYVLLEYTKS